MHPVNIYKSTHRNYDCNKPFQQFWFFQIIFPNDYSWGPLGPREKRKARKEDVYAAIKA